MQKNLFYLVWLVSLLGVNLGWGQSTAYTSLYTSATFQKTINIAYPTGTTGATSDGSGGAASYEVPIYIPPGTNGVQPSLSITYNSLGGNSQLGYGWTLSGLSTITRANKSIYFDGFIQPAEMSLNDKYALDGQRLINISGVYGADATTYSTEVQSFSTITSYGATGGGPLWFKVELKDGTVMEYGNTTDSKVYNGANVLYWRLNKVLYKDGNYIEYTYLTTGDESRINEIKYTGNAAAGLLPYNKLQFTYSLRYDGNVAYEAGKAIASKYLLDKITVTSETQAVKTYELKYGHNNLMSYLKEIVEKGSSGTQINSTIFKYGDEPTAFSKSTTTVGQNVQQDYFPGDINGDGYSDYIGLNRTVTNNIVYHTSFTAYKKTASPSSTSFTAYPTVTLPAGYIAFQPYLGTNHSNRASDFDGDGLADLIFTKTTGSGSSRTMQEFSVYVSPTSGTTYSAPIVKTPYNGWNLVNPTGIYYLVGDFNGDGRSDILTMLGQNSSLYRTAIYYGGASYWLDTGISGTTYFQETDWPSCDNIYVMDFNGDGKDDIMLIKDGFCEIMSYTDAQNAKQIYAAGFPTKWHQVYMGDFNGDGKTDLLTRTSTTNNNAPWYKAISTGTGFIETPFTFSQTPDVNQYYYGDQVMIADYNGDGKSDIAHGWNYWSGPNLYSKIDLYYSKGESFYTTQHSSTNTIMSDPKYIFNFDSDGDGRAEILNSLSYTTPKEIFFFRKEGQEQLLQKVKNGHDYDTEFQYKRMTQPASFYTQGAITAYPLNNIQAPINLLSTLKLENGIGGFRQTNYSYEEAKIHKAGKGFLGFKKVIASNTTTGFKTTEELEFNTTNYISLVKKNSTNLISNNSLINEITNTNAIVDLGNKRFWTKVVNVYENKAFEGRFVSTDNTFDNYGNITVRIINNNNVETTSITNTYGQYGTPVPAMLTSTIQSNTRSGQSAYSKTTTYAYNTIGKITSTAEFSGQPKVITSTFIYNNLGNLTSSSVAASGVATRNMTFGYDTKGRFQTSVTNPQSQSATFTYDNKWGKVLSETGVNGLTTTYVYDQFGRNTSVVKPEGFSITTSYGWAIDATEGTIHYVLSSLPGRPDTKIWYDILDREKKKEEETFGGVWRTQKSSYDAKGNQVSLTLPYKSGETVFTKTKSYDAYNRLLSEVDNFGTTSYAYAYSAGELTVTVTNPASQVSSKKTDASGKLISATDYGGTLTYTYYSHGNVKEVKQGSVVLTSSEYDVYARQTKLTDANAGITQYSTDAFGQTTSMISATGQSFIYAYDVLGRQTYHSRPEGSSSFTYFPSGSGASTNLLKKVTNYGSETTDFTYDALGRNNLRTVTIDGIAHSTSYTFNTYNDVTSVTYPSGFVANYYYDSNGFNTSIKNSNNTITLYSATTMDGLNQVKSYSKGNGKASTVTYNFGTPTRYYTNGVQDLNLTWNYQSGNLTSRYDVIKAKTESFTYDNLNRLLTASGTGLSTISSTFATNGNISTKTDAGTYSYAAGKINAVSKVTNSQNNISTTTQDIVYTSFYQPLNLTEGNYLQEFKYGADDQRIKSTLKLSGTVTNTRYYFWEYEKDITAGTTRHLHYISAGPGLVCIVERIGTTDTYNYTYTDHLGSILTVTNNVGTVTAEQNFDPWGRKRSPSTWQYTSVPTNPVWLYRGFTAHEEMPQFGLINMNGRLYDPIVGRMLSPDNNVQMPDYSQNYNRYSYALNNPLRFTDPDGESIIAAILIGAAIAAAIHTTVHFVANDMSFRNWSWKSFAISVTVGAVSGGVAGAVGPALASAGIGGFYGGAILGASTGFASGLTQGILEGRSFGQTMKMAGIGAGTGLFIGGVVGGIDAELKGQRFLDGKGKVLQERYLVGTGSNPKEGEMSLENIIENSEVASGVEGMPSQRGHNTGAVNSSQFEGDLNVKIRAWPQEGETFYVNVDGKEVFSTNTFYTRTEINVPAGKNIGWGLRGERFSQAASIGNNVMADVSSVPSSYVIVKGNWRSWAGFLFWQ